MGRRRRNRVFPRKSRLARFEQLEPRQLLAVTNLPITNSPDVQQMPSVAVDPNDAKHVVVAYMDYSLTPPLPGDYNGDRNVDAADYTVWRDTLGSTIDLRANGDNTGASAGKIDQADLIVWKANFGQMTGNGSSAITAVPESASILLAALGFLGLAIYCGRTIQ
jgi:hypothetical protein